MGRHIDKTSLRTTHPGQAKASARKKNNRQKKLELLQVTADRLGISTVGVKRVQDVMQSLDRFEAWQCD